MYNPDHELVGYLKSKGIVPEAYSPLGSVGSPLIIDEVVVEIASKHNIKPVEVLLAWLRTSLVQSLLSIRNPGLTNMILSLSPQTETDALFSLNPPTPLVSTQT